MAIDEMRLVLTMDDFERAIAFFRDALGLKQSAVWENDGGRGVLLDAGRATLEVFDESQARAIDEIEVGRRVAGKVRLGFQSSDSASTAADLARAGAEILGGPVITPWGDRNVRLFAPEGIQVTLFTAPAQREAVIDADASFFQALLAQDRTRLDELLAPDFLIVDVRAGDVTNRTDFLAAVGSGEVVFESIETSAQDAVVRTYGDAATVIGTTEMRFRMPDGSSFTGRSRYTHMFTYLDGRWRLASAQGTALPPERGGEASAG